MNAKLTFFVFAVLFCFPATGFSQCTFTVTTTVTNVTCHNGTNGSISVGVSGGISPYQYQLAEAGAGAWQLGNTFSALAAATYPVSVKDATGCIKTVYVTVNQPTTLAIEYVAVDPTCSGSSNGSITVSVSGGTSPYTYSWLKDNAAFSTSQSINNLSLGNYTLTVTDGNGCTAFPVVSQQVKPISMASGFNQDVIAEGANTAADAATNTQVDQTPGNVFYAAGYSNSNGSGVYGLPSSGSFTSTQASSTNYQLASYSSNNALLLRSSSDPSAVTGGTTSGTLIFNSQFKSPYEKLYVVGTTGSGTGVVDYTVHFSDGTMQTGSLNFPDWFLASTTTSVIRALGNLGRVSRVNPGTYDASGQNSFNFWEAPINISGGNQSKIVESIDFSWSALSSSNMARTVLFAVTGYTSTTSGIRVNDGPPSSVTPTVNIASDATGNQFCNGQSVTFTATPINGGSSPSYQWKLNGSNVGTNSPAYTNSGLVSNDQVSLVMTATGGVSCLVTNVANSNTITMTNAAQTAAITAGTTSSSICAGTPVTFTATPSNGGVTPFYQWKLNGGNVGTNSPIYIINTLNNNDQLSVVMTSSIGCAVNNPATSNTITMNVQPLLDPTVSINTFGPIMTLHSSVSDAGSTPGYQWYKNGSLIPGANSSTYFNGSASVGETYSLKLTSSYACKISPSVMSNYITVTSSILPVTLQYFIARAEGNKKAKIEWETTYESNNDAFVLQRKESSQADFESIATISATNNSSGSLYNYTDIVQHYGYYQYRLVQRDVDGHITFSNVAEVIFRGSKGLDIYPNPVVNGTVAIDLAEKSELRLYNGVGQLVLRRQLPAGLTILDVSSLAKGIYSVVANEQSGLIVIK